MVFAHTSSCVFNLKGFYVGGFCGQCSLFYENIFSFFILVNICNRVQDVDIMITCPCNVYPLTPHFYIVKLGFTGVFIFFLIFALKHRSWVLVRTASLTRL